LKDKWYGATMTKKAEGLKKVVELASHHRPNWDKKNKKSIDKTKKIRYNKYIR